ncbi:hypothetical protein [Brevundimonas sp.]|uniref:hypothetical protein n=1 Tax=Brevundimonas sp. TaxID=1871086 RepID=UPI003F6EC787
MARRNRKSGGSRPAARWIKWNDHLAVVFGFEALAGWTAPSQARVSPGRTRMTFSARFTNAEGDEMTARVRCVRDGLGDWFVTSSELDQRWMFEGGE